MARFNVCVLINRDGSNLEQMAQKASDVLANFDINKEVEPYKCYLEPDEIRRIAECYGIDPENLSRIAEKLEEWKRDRGGVDDSGAYGISTKNPDGHIDDWSIVAEIKPDDHRRILFGYDGGYDRKGCKAIVTPEGKWIDGPWIEIFPSSRGRGNLTEEQKEQVKRLYEKQQKQLEEWDAKIATVIDQYKDAAAFLAVCHL